MALSAAAYAGVASPNVFKGAVYNPSVYRDESGCATSAASMPHWSKVTGVGKLMGSTSASTCSKVKGGSTFGSDAYAEPGITVEAPIHFPTGSGGVNISWSITLVGSDTGTVSGSGACPATTSVYDYNYGYTWYNATYTDSYCEAIGEVSLYAYSYIENLSGGPGGYSSNYWSSPFNSSGMSVDTYNDSYTYSNSSYWSYNTSYSGNYSYNYGPSGSITGTYTPTWFINGTFMHSAKYLVYTYMDVDTSSYVEGFTGAHATATLNAATGPNHVQLLAFHPW
jgi:hypothetical protein